LGGAPNSWNRVAVVGDWGSRVAPVMGRSAIYPAFCCDLVLPQVAHGS
jgi:hypothetical protein